MIRPTIPKEREGRSLFWLVFFLTFIVLSLTWKVYFTAELAEFRSITVCALLIGVFISWRFLLGLFSYRHNKPARGTLKEREFTYCICIPCYNEGEHIQRTLESMVFNYPKNKYEIIIVDDSSTDDSREHIKKGVEYLRYEGVKCRVVHARRNQGKRKALAMAISVTDADIVVLVDSDSVVSEEALWQFGKYFLLQKVAAVTAHADVFNPTQSFIARMQVARYFVAFRLMKASESRYGTVTCCSGCCSAYRRAALLPLLRPWTTQTFFGIPQHYSDDRALTNLLLKAGYDTKYANEIRAWTIVPHSVKKFVKQQMRWRRGWLVNSFVGASFMWKRTFPAAFMYYGTLVMAPLSIAVLVVTLVWGIQTQTLDTFMAGFALAVVLPTLMYGAAYSIFRKDHYWIYGILWTFLYLVIIIWQLPWAIITVRQNQWGTR